ncbi:protein SMALL AUXIN UP-REGULATED RNA 10-like [Zingiber officinale]|uniref:Uncharacterized protein n=1 Tax=Zingiber officinale TaxID=94328 RepID=A0A8J5IAG6_ZINOF|nr:protein SMALL AUXIN UP-REGULATED RNA 10-like [Zingiber officinale]KAG6531900.1 hypothetical protein ZIOFF_005735 [Zingiber officinale]
MGRGAAAAARKGRREAAPRQRGSSPSSDEEEERAGGAPEDVPRGHFVVYVGANRRRFVLPIAYLDRPDFRRLLRQAEEEFGFKHRMGLTIPCDELAFRSLLLA